MTSTAQKIILQGWNVSIYYATLKNYQNPVFTSLQLTLTPISVELKSMTNG
jgi:hypothetical protein